MQEYALKSKDGETIKKVKATCIENAVTVIAKLKQLSEEQLLSIFDVAKVS